jgi:hypothetical protein
VIFCGIDPGKSGHIVFINEDSEVLEELPMPWSGDRLNAALAMERMSAYTDKRLRVTIEKVSARLGNGVASCFKFGMAYGAISVIVDLVACPVHFISPATWKKRMLTGVNKDDKKAASIEAAKNLFPGLRPKLQKKSSHDLAEAALLALYGQRMWLRGEF